MLSLLFVLITMTEVERVQAHIAGAEEVLRAADTSALTEAQRARRAAVIEELARYRARGEFPRNLDFAERTPYFIDDRGVRCAMAHLIETFGGAALVARVARTANNAYVPELAADPALRAWLDAHGMTVAEAARVQPGYEQQLGYPCGGLFWCAEGDVCMPAPDRPDEVSYCTRACELAGCPYGMQGVRMQCEEVDGEPRCIYPQQTPGTSGWRCDQGTIDQGMVAQCLETCVLDRATGEGECIASRDCPEDLCAQNLACFGGNTDEPPCTTPVDDGGGCAAGGGAPGMLTLLLCAIVGACSRLRSRPART